MMRFQFTADAVLFAENIDEAFQKLADHFQALADDGEVPSIFERGTIEIEPLDESGE